MNIPQELISALEKRSIILFLGADLPQKITGVPSRDELAQSLVEKHGIEEMSSLSRVSDLVVRENQRWTITSFIKDEIDRPKIFPSYFHYQLVDFIQKLEIKTIITICYDTFLERALSDQGVGFDVIVRKVDIPFIREDRLNIFKLYGDIRNHESLTITSQDQNRLEKEKHDILAEVDSRIRRNSILFIGYREVDNSLPRLIKINVAEDPFIQPNFIVWQKLPTNERKRWQLLIGAATLDLNPSDFLGNFVNVPLIIPRNLATSSPSSSSQHSETIASTIEPVADSSRDIDTRHEEVVKLEHISDEFIQILEKELRKKMSYWKETGFIQPQSDKNFTYAYFSQQAKRVQELRNHIDFYQDELNVANVHSRDFFEKTLSLLSQTQKDGKLLSQLVRTHPETSLSITLSETADDVIIKVKKAKNTLVQSRTVTEGPNKIHQLETDFYSLVLSLDVLSELLQAVSNKALGSTQSLN